MGCVYVWTNTVNGKQYVGMSIKPGDRKKSHLSSIRSGKGCYAFHNAVRKYGEDAFTYEEVFWSEDRKELAAREIEEIAMRGTFKDPSKGYNLTPGGDGITEFSPEMKAKLAATNARPEVKARRSALSKAIASRPDVMARRLATYAITNALPETKARRSAASKAANARPGVIEKRASSVRAAFARPEVKAKMREAQARPEVKAKVSAGSKAAWANLEHRAMRLASINAAYERPGVRARQLAAMKEALSRPDVRARQLAAMKIASARPEYRALKTQQSTEMWREDGFREKRAEGMAKAWEQHSWADKLSEASKRVWDDADKAEWIRQQVKAGVQTQKNREFHSVNSQERWADPEYRERYYTRHNMDKVEDDQGVVYECIKDAATKLGVDRDAIYHAIKSGKFKRIPRSTGNKGFGRTPRPCIVDGVVYPSFRAAAVAHGISDGTVTIRVASTLSRLRWWEALPFHNHPECDAVEECWAVMQWAAANGDHPNVPDWLRPDRPKHGPAPAWAKRAAA